MSSRGGLRRALADLAADLTSLAESHLRLAAREAGDQSRQATGAVLRLILGLLVAQAGVLLAAAAVGLWVGGALGHPAWGLGAVGAVLLVAGLVVAVWARRLLTAIRPLEETLEELEESRRWMQEEALPTLRDGGRG